MLYYCNLLRYSNLLLLLLLADEFSHQPAAASTSPVGWARSARSFGLCFVLCRILLLFFMFLLERPKSFVGLMSKFVWLQQLVD